jgi:hypothetical protein
MAYSTIKGLQFGTSTGVADVYAITLSSVSLLPGFTFEMKLNISNGGPSTLNVNGTGIKALVDSDLNPLVADDIEADSTYLICWNSTIPIGGGWQVLGLAKPTPITIKSYGQVYSNTAQLLAPGDNVTFDNIQNNTVDISFTGPSTDIIILTTGTYRIDYVLRSTK